MSLTIIDENGSCILYCNNSEILDKFIIIKMLLAESPNCKITMNSFYATALEYLFEKEDRKICRYSYKRNVRNNIIYTIFYLLGLYEADISEYTFWSKCLTDGFEDYLNINHFTTITKLNLENCSKIDGKLLENFINLTDLTIGRPLENTIFPNTINRLTIVGCTKMTYEPYDCKDDNIRVVLPANLIYLETAIKLNVEKYPASIEKIILGENISCLSMFEDVSQNFKILPNVTCLISYRKRQTLVKNFLKTSFPKLERLTISADLYNYVTLYYNFHMTLDNPIGSFSAKCCSLLPDNLDYLDTLNTIISQTYIRSPDTDFDSSIFLLSSIKELVTAGFYGIKYTDLPMGLEKLTFRKVTNPDTVASDFSSYYNQYGYSKKKVLDTYIKISSIERDELVADLVNIGWKITVDDSEKISLEKY